LAIKKRQSFKNKKVLITAGPTWVPIDAARVISNIATGSTGILLAEKLQILGAQVTLVLGPVEGCCLSKKVRLLRFTFFDELNDVIRRELHKKEYDIIIHSAAVSDFRPRQYLKGKLDSDKPYDLKLVTLPRIIDNIRRLAPEAKLVMFKLEIGIPDRVLMRKAKMAQAKVNADFVVANSINPYRAFVIDKKGNSVSVRSKSELVKNLLKILN